MTDKPFVDRRHAGRLLAARLSSEYAGRSDVLVLALPRGGVPVAAEVAAELGAPLDVFLVRKLGTPRRPELAFGAVTTGSVVLLDREVVRALAIPDHVIEATAAEGLKELARREREYRGDLPPPDLGGRTVILVDDGLATAACVLAAIAALRQQQPGRIVVAVPIASRDRCDQLVSHADEVVCTIMPEPLHAVGHWYDDFSTTSDDEVRDMLADRKAPETTARQPDTVRESASGAPR